MVVDRNIDNLSDLALTLSNNLLNSLDDVLNNVSSTLDLDGVAIGLLLGELDCSRKLASVIRTTGLDNDVSKGCACNVLV